MWKPALETLYADPWAMFMASAHAMEPIVEELFSHDQFILLRTRWHLGNIDKGEGAAESLHVDNLLLCTGPKKRQKRSYHPVRPYEVCLKDSGEVSCTEILHLVVGAVLLYGGIVDEHI